MTAKKNTTPARAAGAATPATSGRGEAADAVDFCRAAHADAEAKLVAARARLVAAEPEDATEAHADVLRAESHVRSAERAIAAAEEQLAAATRAERLEQLDELASRLDAEAVAGKLAANALERQKLAAKLAALDVEDRDAMLEHEKRHAAALSLAKQLGVDAPLEALKPAKRPLAIAALRAHDAATGGVRSQKNDRVAFTAVHRALYGTDGHANANVAPLREQAESMANGTYSALRRDHRAAQDAGARRFRVDEQALKLARLLAGYGDERGEAAERRAASFANEFASQNARDGVFEGANAGELLAAARAKAAKLVPDYKPSPSGGEFVGVGRLGGGDFGPDAA